MAYIDIEISASDWALAEKLVRDMKEVSFDVFGLDDETLIEGAASIFQRGSTASGSSYSFIESIAVICAAFEELYGMTPQCYWEQLDNKPPDVVRRVERRKRARRDGSDKILPVIIWDIPE